MKNKTIEDQKLSSFAKKYFSNNFSELEPQTLNNLKNKVENNKQSRRKNFWLKLTYSTTALCCLIALCVILPLTLRPEQLYTYTDLTQRELALEYCQEYIEQNFPKYDFIFDECDFSVSYGQYAKDELYILGLRGTKSNIPFTYLEFTLIINQGINYPEKEDYIVGAEIIEKAEYVLYKKVMDSFQNQIIYALFDYDGYDLYLELNIDDEELLNKFL